MNWVIEYYRDEKDHEPVAEFIDSLPQQSIIKILRTLKLLQSYGVLLKEPHTKQIRDKLRELRIKDNKGAIRILYFTYTGRKFILLHGFIKKTVKTPEREIEAAEKRMKSYIERNLL